MRVRRGCLQLLTVALGETMTSCACACRVGGWVVAPAEMYARASEEAFAAGDGRAGSEYAAKAEELLSAQS